MLKLQKSQKFQKSSMLNRIYLITGLSLLTACGGSPALPSPSSAPEAVVLGTYDSGILPGSKGDRSHLASVELELNLPLETAFTLAQLTREEAETWYIEVDGKRPARVRLSSARPGGDGQLLTFVLEDVSVFTHARVHELLIYSAEGVLQTAGLMTLPVNQTLEQTRAPEPLTSQTLAEWLIARELLNGKPLQKLAPEVLVQLQTTPETQSLTQELKDLYRQSRGKSDPRKSTKAEAAARAAADKQAEKLAKRAAQTEKKPDKHRADHL